MRARKTRRNNISKLEEIRFLLDMTQQEMGEAFGMNRLVYRRFELITGQLFTNFLTYDEVLRLKQIGKDNPRVLKMIDDEIKEAENNISKMSIHVCTKTFSIIKSQLDS